MDRGILSWLTHTSPLLSPLSWQITYRLVYTDFLLVLAIFYITFLDLKTIIKQYVIHCSSGSSALQVDQDSQQLSIFPTFWLVLCAWAVGYVVCQLSGLPS